MSVLKHISVNPFLSCGDLVFATYQNANGEKRKFSHRMARELFEDLAVAEMDSYLRNRMGITLDPDETLVNLDFHCSK